MDQPNSEKYQNSAHQISILKKKCDIFGPSHNTSSKVVALPKIWASFVLIKLFKWSSTWPCCCQTYVHCRWHFSSFLKEKCCFHFAPINCAKWPITSGPCKRKLQRQTERRRRNSHLNGKLPERDNVTDPQCSSWEEEFRGPPEQSQRLLSVFSYFSSFFCPCDWTWCNPPLWGRFSFTETETASLFTGPKFTETVYCPEPQK